MKIRFMVIGITGGIASGKSNISMLIKSLGYLVIDADEISRSLSKKNNSIYFAIINNFGTDYLDEFAEIDRKKLARKIFSEKQARLKLDEITHPLIVEEMRRRINLSKEEIIFLDIPLLFEAKLEYLCDKILCVYLKKELQVKRLMKRDNIDYTYALKKIESQLDLDIKASKSDYVINSNGSFEQTKEQLLKIIKKIEGEKHGNN